MIYVLQYLMSSRNSRISSHVSPSSLVPNAEAAKPTPSEKTAPQEPRKPQQKRRPPPPPPTAPKDNKVAPQKPREPQRRHTNERPPPPISIASQVRSLQSRLDDIRTQTPPSLSQKGYKQSEIFVSRASATPQRPKTSARPIVEQIIQQDSEFDRELLRRLKQLKAESEAAVACGNLSESDKNSYQELESQIQSRIKSVELHLKFLERFHKPDLQHRYDSPADLPDRLALAPSDSREYYHTTVAELAAYAREQGLKPVESGKSYLTPIHMSRQVGPTCQTTSSISILTHIYGLHNVPAELYVVARDALFDGMVRGSPDFAFGISQPVYLQQLGFIPLNPGRYDVRPGTLKSTMENISLLLQLQGAILVGGRLSTPRGKVPKSPDYTFEGQGNHMIAIVGVEVRDDGTSFIFYRDPNQPDGDKMRKAKAEDFLERVHSSYVSIAMIRRWSLPSSPDTDSKSPPLSEGVQSGLTVEHYLRKLPYTNLETALPAFAKMAQNPPVGQGLEKAKLEFATWHHEVVLKCRALQPLGCPSPSPSPNRIYVLDEIFHAMVEFPEFAEIMSDTDQCEGDEKTAASPGLFLFEGLKNPADCISKLNYEYIRQLALSPPLGKELFVAFVSEIIRRGDLEILEMVINHPLLGDIKQGQVWEIFRTSTPGLQEEYVDSLIKSEKETHSPDPVLDVITKLKEMKAPKELIDIAWTKLPKKLQGKQYELFQRMLELKNLDAPDYIIEAYFLEVLTYEQGLYNVEPWIEEGSKLASLLEKVKDSKDSKDSKD